MKLSQLFGQTLRDAPADAEGVNRNLLMLTEFICPRAGMDAVKSAYTTNGTQARGKFGL